MPSTHRVEVRIAERKVDCERESCLPTEDVIGSGEAAGFGNVVGGEACGFVEFSRELQNGFGEVTGGVALPCFEEQGAVSAGLHFVENLQHFIALDSDVTRERRFRFG